MARIKHRRGRHFMDENGRLFWINGPEEHCYLSEQRQWRCGLSFEDVLDWKQCAPSGLVSQRFGSLRAACEAYEHQQIAWYQDLYLRRMGDQMAAHRSDLDYKPTAMQEAEARGARPRIQPWRLPEPAGPVCGLPPRTMAAAPADRAAPEAMGQEITHARRRRRSLAGLQQGAPLLSPPVR